MRPQIEPLEETLFPCGGPDPEEEKVWGEARVPQETILCREGLVIFQLFNGRRRSDD